MWSTHGISARGLGLCLLAILGTGANCQEQFAATFDHDGGLIQVHEARDASAADGVLADGSPADGASYDQVATDLVAIDVVVSDGSGTDRTAIDVAGNDASVRDATGSDRSGVDGASTDSGGGYHPGNWFTDHRAAALLGQADCRMCHGADLAGGAVNVSCDICHQIGWRTNCTYCHGGTDNQTGAPPIDLRGQTTTTISSVGAHSEHVAMPARNHPDYGCIQCHVRPTDVLSAGHVFDDTPGQAELIFAAGLSPNGSYDFSADTCATVYCHGSGRSDGNSPPNTGSIATCTACHANVGSASQQLATMSGRHALHIGLGVTCAICHGMVVDSSNAVIAPDLHVNGEKNVQPVGGTYNGTTCTNTCHSAGSGPWQGPLPDGGLPEGGVVNYHTDPLWATRSYHGLAAEEGTLNCFTCHGAQLQGSGSAVACDSCHNTVDPGWRTNCVFCHGGYAGDTSGAPPVDLHDNTLASATKTVGAHVAHVQRTNHPAWDCAQCHARPSSVTSAGHMYDGVNDTTAGVAEVALGAGLSPAGSYDPGSATCSNLYCHGNGQVNASAPAFTTTINTCDACHPASGSSAAQLATMSGRHATHIGRGASCSSCHGMVVDNSNAVIAPDLHVNGVKNVAPLGGSYDGTSCTTSCHTGSRTWAAAVPDGGWPEGGPVTYHTDPQWSLATVHGRAAKEGNENCFGCHGSQLQGSGSAVSCDSCHTAG